jgi:hypothetical protein
MEYGIMFRFLLSACVVLNSDCQLVGTNHICRACLINLSVQEYDAAVQDEEDAATPKLRWEIEQVGYNSTLQAEIAR